MWTAADRERYGRDGLRYPSDLTDAEWALIASLIRPAKRGGRRRSVAVREVMDGLLYVLETGCQWRHLPRDLPPRSTVHGYLRRCALLHRSPGWEASGRVRPGRVPSTMPGHPSCRSS